MKRPILVAVIAYIIGILWGLYIQWSIVPFYIILFIIITIIFKYNKEKLIKYKSIIILIIIASTISNIQIRYLNNKYNTMYKDMQETKIVATVISDMQEEEYKYTCTIKVESVNGNLKYRNTKLILNIKKNVNIPEYGDKIVLNGTYIEPSTSRNYKGFNYKEYLKTIQIYGTITCNSEIKIIKKNDVNVILEYIYNIKEIIKKNVSTFLEGDIKDLCLGILLGDTENLNNEIKEKFKISNLYHILAISGMHISYLIVGATFILEKSKINKKISRILIIILLLFFMILTGLSPSVMRAGIMGIILIGARNIL